MAKYLISFPSAAMVVPDGEWEAVGHDAHTVIDEAKAAGVYVFGGGIDEDVPPTRVSVDGTVAEGGSRVGWNDLFGCCIASSSCRNPPTGANVMPTHHRPQDCGSNPKTRSSWSQRHAFAMRAAHATASSREGSSSTVKPPSSAGAHG